jgi:TatD DNase family protein
VIDTHCHLTFPNFQAPKAPGGVAGVLAEAAAHGVMGCITISTTTLDCLEALSIATAFPNVWCTAGVHPLHSHEGPHGWGNLRTVARHERCVAWGELGLDNHYDDPPRVIQDRVLAEQLAFIQSCTAEGIKKPIVVHCREAFADLLPILRESGMAPEKFVFHCFTGTADEARLVLDFGAFISFTGVVTYKNAPEVREAARLAPADRIMVETDAPFLSPEPKRTVRPCAPWMSSITARFLAELRGVSWEEFHGQINENTRRFFGIAAT